MVGFEATLKSNQVRDWSRHYCAYTQLKEHIYETADATAEEGEGGGGGSAARGRGASPDAGYASVPMVEIGGSSASPRSPSAAALSVSELELGCMPEILADIRRVDAFYRSKEKRLLEETEVLLGYPVGSLDIGGTGLRTERGGAGADLEAGAAVGGEGKEGKDGSGDLGRDNDPEGAPLLGGAPPAKKASRRWDIIRNNIEALEEEDAGFEDGHPKNQSRQRAFTDLYRQLNYLRNFASINYTAFVRLVVKQDNRLPDYPLKARFILHATASARFFHYASTLESSAHAKTGLGVLFNKLRQSFAEQFCHGDLAMAKSTLLMKQDAAYVCKRVSGRGRGGVCLCVCDRESECSA
jgi:hypothetical protein